MRGKAGIPVEFGAKISVSLVAGVSFVDRISWDAYNESVDLVEQIDAYHCRFGHDPASVHADQLYRTRENRRYCASKGIRLSGPPLGRPRKISEATAGQVQHEHHQAHADATARMAIEGKFGQGKRRLGLGRLMAKLALTSETMIHVSFLVMNVEHLLTRGIFYWLSSWWQGWRSTWSSRLSARWLQMQVNFRDDRGESRAGGQELSTSSRKSEWITKNAFFSKP
ncbi:MAG: transposase [Nitrospirales bacterium]|nr:transposase [Nitrospirales bacterium]